jgi:hypothetical protein
VPRTWSRSYPGVVHRTARIALRCTAWQAARCFGLLVAGGDVWAGLTDLNDYRFRHRERPVFSYQELCREATGVKVGELSTPALACSRKPVTWAGESGGAGSAHVKDLGRHDARRLGAEELDPRGPGSPRCGSEAVTVEDGRDASLRHRNADLLQSFMIRATVLAARRTPSLSSSPWMRR